MKAKEAQEKLVAGMHKWQKIENATITATAHALEQTDNPLLRTIMGIIQSDCHTHHRVQQMIIDSMEREAVHLTFDEIGKLDDAIAKHIQIERDAIKLAEECMEALKGSNLHAQKYLLDYLIEDEKKHERLLAGIEMIKRDIYHY